MKFLEDKMYKTRNGSKVLHTRDLFFRVIFLQTEIPEKYRDEGWSGLCEDDVFQVVDSGAYIGPIRELDIVSEWQDCEFEIEKEYKTKNESLVKYLGDQEFEILRGGQVSKQTPWILQEKGSRYFTDKAGRYLGSIRELDVILSAQ